MQIYIIVAVMIENALFENLKKQKPLKHCKHYTSTSLLLNIL